MNLVLPIPTVTLGPEWAQEINDAFDVVDLHNHTSGKGVPVPAAGLNINANLTFQSNSAIQLKSSRYAIQNSPLGGPSDLACQYSAGANGDMYWNDGLGNQIQITAGGALNAASIGGIGGDYATSTASVFYTSLDNTFTFWQSPNTPATLDVGSIIVRQEVSSGFGVTISADPSQSAGYEVFLPVALPASQKFMTLDNLGNIAAPWEVDNDTIKVVANELVSYSDGEHAWELNGKYSGLTFPLTNIDSIFIAPFDIDILSVWIYASSIGASGTTEFDLKLGDTANATYTSIFSVTGKIASTASAVAPIWTDSGSIISSQTGVTKPVLSTTSMNAGQGLRFDLIQSMDGNVLDARIRIIWKKA